MRNVKWLLAGAAMVGMITAAGCGSNLDSGGDQTGPGTTVANAKAVGVQNCVQCHSALANIWIASNHGNPNLFPSGQGDCAVCHDPNGDSVNLFTAFNRQEPERGVIGCEACHGGGEFHWGVGPIPFPSPEPQRCGTGACHSALPADEHLVFHPEGNRIVEKYLASAHGTADSLRNEDICTRCHNHEGALRYLNVTTALDLATLVKPVPGEVSTVQCKTCHDPHDPTTLLVAASATASTEYNTCTNCHQSHNADLNAANLVAVVGTTPATGTSDSSLIHTDGTLTSTVLLYHTKRYSRIIADTHYDNPATASLVEGYAMNTSNEHVCRDCHDVHAADVTINEQWAESGHAGQILQAKQAAAFNATDRTFEQTQAVQAAGGAGVWVDDPWATEAERSCQRCHTATGVKNLLGDPLAYYAAINSTAANPNDFSYMVPGQVELLYCWACHSNNSGALRNAGNPLPLEDRNRVIFATIPDIGKSGVCMACHGGRGNSDTIRNSSRSTSFRAHHAPTGGAVFNEITHTGYEFALNGTALNYANPAHLHDDISRNGDTPESGDGPCAGCHMPGANHTFESVVRVNGTLTTITAQALCNTCHTAGTIGTIAPAGLITLRAGQDQAVDLLGLYLSNGTSFTNADGVIVPADPTITNHLGIVLDNTNVVDANVTPLDDYGAFQNWKYTDGEDPCAYVHNGKYVKRLVYDSIDLLNNGTLDGNVAIVPSTYTAAATWLGADTLGNIARP